MRTMLLKLTVMDGGREHSHKIMVSTRCKSLWFAAQWYASHYWGETEWRDGNYYFQCGGEIAVRVEHFTELNEENVKTLREIGM